jgi:hypothetical protein
MRAVADDNPLKYRLHELIMSYEVECGHHGRPLAHPVVSRAQSHVKNAVEELIWQLCEKDSE